MSVRAELALRILVAALAASVSSVSLWCIPSWAGKKHHVHGQQLFTNFCLAVLGASSCPWWIIDLPGERLHRSNSGDLQCSSFNGVGRERMGSTRVDGPTPKCLISVVPTGLAVRFSWGPADPAMNDRAILAWPYGPLIRTFRSAAP
jgi:hypothetical protein